MPSPDAHKQLRKALKFGPPVWWAEFLLKYHVELIERPMRRVVAARDRAAVAAGLI